MWPLPRLLKYFSQVLWCTCRHWRWRGFLTDYYTDDVPDVAASLQKPAVLLVHGFGAFGEQWRGQIKGLSEAGYQVRATPCLHTCPTSAVCSVFMLNGIVRVDGMDVWGKGPCEDLGPSAQLDL